MITPRPHELTLQAAVARHFLDFLLGYGVPCLHLAPRHLALRARAAAEALGAELGLDPAAVAAALTDPEDEAWRTRSCSPTLHSLVTRPPRRGRSWPP